MNTCMSRAGIGAYWTPDTGLRVYREDWGHAFGRSSRQVEPSFRRLISCISLAFLVLISTHANADRLIVWGDDSSNQISNAPDGAFRAVAGGSFNGLALRPDGSPVFWGSAPIGPPAMPELIATGRYRAIALGRDDAVLIRWDGTLAAWGKNPLITNVLPGSYRGAAVAVVHAVAIADDQSLVAWGSDSYQDPLTGDLFAGLLNVSEGRPFKAVDARLLYSIALHENGTLLGWGHGAQGANVLGDWTPTPEDPDIRFIPGSVFIAIAAGNTHALAIQRDGRVTGWGNDGDPALQAPAHVKFKAISAGWGFSVGIASDGKLWGWGTPVKSPFATEAWTFASLGWRRQGDSDHYYVPRMRFKSIAAAAFHIMATTDDS